MGETDLLETYRLFSHPSGMQPVNRIDPGVSKTQPLATFLHRSAVIALLRCDKRLSGGIVGSILPKDLQQMILEMTDVVAH